jgi:hypothetical protein
MCAQQVQIPFSFLDIQERETPSIATAVRSNDNSVSAQDRAFHNWYRFVLSYPPHLVRDYIDDFDLNPNAIILDPFCGTGTTVLEAKLHRFHAIGVEANPFPHFASCVKTDWSVSPDELQLFATKIAALTYEQLSKQGIDDRRLSSMLETGLRRLDAQAERALIKDSISPLPLHKTLVLLDHINQHKNSPIYSHALLALGNALVTQIGNLRFGPEVGVGKIKTDVSVVGTWMQEMRNMVEDLRTVHGEVYPPSVIHLADARNLKEVIRPQSVNAVITSPPYPNEKDYTRTTRLESVVLGFFTDMAQLRSHKQRLLRSNTRGVYTTDDDDKWIADNQKIQNLAKTIEERRIELGKTSGFEKLYGRVTKLYFGGMARHLHDLKTVLAPGARLAYVVGDQASYLQVMIRTGELLAEIADSHGYEVERIDLFRTRFATATQMELREEVVVLHWPG